MFRVRSLAAKEKAKETSKTTGDGMNWWRQWRNAAHNIRCGMHSGIPLCCVTQYTVEVFCRRYSPQRTMQYYHNNRFVGPLANVGFRPCSWHLWLLERVTYQPPLVRSCSCRSRCPSARFTTSCCGAINDGATRVWAPCGSSAGRLTEDRGRQPTLRFSSAK